MVNFVPFKKPLSLRWTKGDCCAMNEEQNSDILSSSRSMKRSQNGNKEIFFVPFKNWLQINFCCHLNISKYAKNHCNIPMKQKQIFFFYFLVEYPKHNSTFPCHSVHFIFNSPLWMSEYHNEYFETCWRFCMLIICKGLVLKY